ncbi:hypothetical protein AB7303_01975 [Providencia rettgeri]
MSKVFKLQYYPLAIAAKHLKCDEIELLILAHAGDIVFYQYPDPTLLIDSEPVSLMDIGAILIRGTKTGQRYRDILSDVDIQLTDIVLPIEEMEKASRFLNMTEDERKKEPRINTTAKQSKFIVGLLRALKFTDNDFKGSLPELITKIETRAPEVAGIVEDEGKTLADWLKKADIKR